MPDLFETHQMRYLSESHPIGHELPFSFETDEQTFRIRPFALSGLVVFVDEIQAAT